MTGLIIILSIGFPFFIWFYGWENPQATAVYLLVVIALRLLSHNKPKRSLGDKALIVGGSLIVIALLSGFDSVSLYYPVLVNLMLLIVFSTSLLSPPGIIETIARKQEKENFDQAIQVYTHQLTKLWCVFFIINGGIAFYFAYFKILDAWALYTGVIAYVLIGLFLGGEFLVRKRLVAKVRQSLKNSKNNSINNSINNST